MDWRVVLDSMVWAQAAANPEGPAGKTVELARDRKFTLIASGYIRDEVRETFKDAYFARKLGATFDAEGWLTTTLVATSELVEVTGPAVLVEHAKDDPILWAAAAGDASHLVTWENRLLRLSPYRFTQVVTPVAFLREWRIPKVSETLSAWKAMRRSAARGK